MVGDEFYVYGTPFSGKHDLSRNTRAKLGGICFIERAEQNSISKMDINDVIFNMLTQTLRRFPKERMDKMLTLLDKLLSNVGVYKLCCNTCSTQRLFPRPPVTSVLSSVPRVFPWFPPIPCIACVPSPCCWLLHASVQHRCRKRPCRCWKRSLSGRF